MRYPLRVPDSAFDLEQIHLGDNKLKELPASFGRLKKLEPELTIRKNAFTTLLLSDPGFNMGVA